MATESQVVRARGSNPAEVKRRRKVEVDENRELGLKFDTDLTNTQLETSGGFSSQKDEINQDE